MAEGLQKSSDSKQNNVEESLEAQLSRIAEFVLRKWITEEEEKCLVMLLQRDFGRGNQNGAVRYVRKKLDDIEAKARTTGTKKPVHSLESTYTSNDEDKKKIMEHETAQLTDLEAVHKIDQSTASKFNLDSDQVSDLFVEMCFFARLGFLQPPCCLYCSFQQCPTNQKAADEIIQRETKQCHRYIIWRKDAKILLSRKSLAGNMLLIRCCDAQKLILGEEVLSKETAWRWDFTNQSMIESLQSSV